MTDLSCDSYDSAPPRGTGPTCTRVYLRGGHYAHLQWDDTRGYVMCERGHDRDGDPLPCHHPDDWYGTGSQHEYDKAAALPTCPRCFTIRERRLPDARLGTGHSQEMT